MILRLIRREFLDHLRSTRFLLLSILSAAFVLASVFDGYLTYSSSLEEYREAEQATADRIHQIKTFNFSRPAKPFNYGELFNQGYWVHRPPAVLSVFARGIEPVLGRSGRIVAQPDRWLKWSRASEQRLDDLFAPLDLVLTVQIVIGLVVVLFTYDSVCGEKETGTLRLLASFPVSRHQLVAAKLIGALLPVMLGVGIPLVAAVACVTVAPDVQLAPRDWLRLAVLVGSLLMTVCVLSAAGVFASSLTGRSGTAFALILGYWAVAVVVLPRLSLVVADQIRTAPVVAEYEKRKVAARSEAYEEVRERVVDAFYDAYEKEHGEGPWSSPEGREQYYQVNQRYQEEALPLANARERQLTLEFRNRQDAFMSASTWLARLSPTFSTGHAAVQAAGTGTTAHRNARDAYLAYLSEVDLWRNRTFTRDQLKRHAPAGKYGEYKWDVSDLPTFRYSGPYSDSDLAVAAIELGMAVLWGVLFAAGTWVRLVRYDVR